VRYYYRALGGLKDRCFPSSSNDSSLLHEDFVALRDIVSLKTANSTRRKMDATETSRNLHIQDGMRKVQRALPHKKSSGKIPSEMKLIN
jgi:hypothetical protein